MPDSGNSLQRTRWPFPLWETCSLRRQHARQWQFIANILRAFSLTFWHATRMTKCRAVTSHCNRKTRGLMVRLPPYAVELHSSITESRAGAGRRIAKVIMCVRFSPPSPTPPCILLNPTASILVWITRLSLHNQGCCWDQFWWPKTVCGIFRRWRQS